MYVMSSVDDGGQGCMALTFWVLCPGKKKIM